MASSAYPVTASRKFLGWNSGCECLALGIEVLRGSVHMCTFILILYHIWYFISMWVLDIYACYHVLRHIYIHYMYTYIDVHVYVKTYIDMCWQYLSTALIFGWVLVQHSVATFELGCSTDWVGMKSHSKQYFHLGFKTPETCSTVHISKFEGQQAIKNNANTKKVYPIQNMMLSFALVCPRLKILERSRQTTGHRAACCCAGRSWPNVLQGTSGAVELRKHERHNHIN